MPTTLGVVASHKSGTTAAGEGYAEFPGTAGNRFTTADEAGFHITGDMCVTWKVALADWTPAANNAVVSRYVTGTNNRSFQIRHEADGSITWIHSTDGTSAGNKVHASNLVGGVHPLASLAPLAIRWCMVTIDVNNGASGYDVRWWTSTDNAELDTAVTGWTQLGTADTGAGTTSIFAGTAPMDCATTNGGLEQPLNGRLYAVNVRSGIGAGGTFGGTLVYGWRADDLPADNGAATQTFTSSPSGDLVTVHRSGSPDTLLVPSGVGGPPPAALVFDGYFPIGVDLQTASTTVIDKWVARGIDMFVRSVPLNGDPTAWSAVIQADGRVKQIRHPKPTPANDIGVSTLFAWSQWDEPDLTSVQDNPLTFEDLQAEYATLKGTANIPVFLNVTGQMIQHDIRYYPGLMPNGQTAHSEPWMKEYFAAADILCCDNYPANRGRMGVAHTDHGDAVTKLETWQHPEFSRPIMQYLECSDYSTAADRPAPGPTAAEMRGQMWLLICFGARGLIYFPQRVAPTYIEDNTPAANAAEMPIQHARINSIETVLQGPIDPAGTSVTVSHPMYACWRHTATHKYIIVVNFSNATRSAQVIPMTGVTGVAEVVGESRNVNVVSGAITDTFLPYVSHIYKVPN